ncbi:MAG: GFA family protein [Deltaproteobacteria bacterium]|nr:GFA family protein [Deltaproteobacteria bacterium]
MTDSLSGGCQCGAIRFQAQRLKDNSHVCHCRMCQKAAGNFFMALVGVPLEDFTWTRGQPSFFASSVKVKRGFCANCGTPLFFRHQDSQHISMTIGSFDHPENIPLAFELGIEAKLPQIAQLGSIRNYGTTEENDPEGSKEIKQSSAQHPDQDTKDWTHSASQNF